MVNRRITLATALFCVFFSSSVFSEDDPKITPMSALVGEPIPSQSEYLPQTGDIIAHISKTRQSELIRIATSSDYTHIGLVVERDNEYFVLEAASTVRYTPLNDWINRGVEKKYTVKRPIFTDFDLEGLVLSAEKYLDKDYDPKFDPSDERIYCSELVQKAYEAIGIPLGDWQPAKEMSGLKNPKVAKEAKRRWGEIPSDLVVVTPQSIMNSPYLFTVYSNFN